MVATGIVLSDSVFGVVGCLNFINNNSYHACSTYVMMPQTDSGTQPCCTAYCGRLAASIVLIVFFIIFSGTWAGHEMSKLTLIMKFNFYIHYIPCQQVLEFFYSGFSTYELLLVMSSLASQSLARLGDVCMAYVSASIYRYMYTLTGSALQGAATL